MSSPSSSVEHVTTGPLAPWETLLNELPIKSQLEVADLELLDDEHLKPLVKSVETSMRMKVIVELRRLKRGAGLGGAEASGAALNTGNRIVSANVSADIDAGEPVRSSKS